MPRLIRRVPRYSKHRASGQAVVTLSGQDFYLGPHDTKASKLEYDRVISEWLARGRRPLGDPDEETGMTVVELIVAYKRFCDGYYRKNGKVTNEVTAILNAAKVVRKLYGREPGNAFDSLKLQAVQQAMILEGWSRKHINKQMSRVIRMFAWGVAQKLVKADELAAMREVRGLHKGRCDARESEPVRPVDNAVVAATLNHLPPIVGDMVRLQRLTGCRPEEVCLIRPCDLEMNGAVWAYRPESHKTAHQGRDRVIFIGPQGQAILRPYLLRASSCYCFCPAESERRRRAEMHMQRITPIGYGNRPGTNRRRAPKWQAGLRYTTGSYRRAIHRACELAFEMPRALRQRPKVETQEQKAKREELARTWRNKHCWSPNQLRHSAATEIRKRFGLEASQVVLGHAGADVSQIYAERDLQKAAEVMEKVG